MIDPKIVLQRLHDSLNILQERQAKPGLDAPAGLTREIEDHQTAIHLTELLAAGRLTETAWREQLQPLLVTIEARQATEAISVLNIGGVRFSDISGSTITVGNIDASIHAGGDVVGGDQVTQTAHGSNIAQASHGGKAAVNVTDLRGQQVSGDQYNVTGDQHIHHTKEEAPFWKHLSRVQLIVAILLGLIATAAVIWTVPDAREVVYDWFAPLLITPAAEGERRIVIAKFHVSENVIDTEPHIKIKRAIEKAAAEAGLDNLRVEIGYATLDADQREKAESLGALHNAEMVIWGEDTGVQVLVNFYNLKQPDFDAADVPITENERTLIANPSAYGKFIVGDLPKQLTFLAFFAVGQSYYSNEQYQRAAEVIEAGITAVEEPDGNINPDGLAEAYFRLGWLYQALDDPQTANIRYTSSIALVPVLSTYNNRGTTYADLEQYDKALADYNEAIRLNPDDADAYNNRGATYAALGRYDEALADFNKTIRLNPDDATTYYNRGTTYADLDQYNEALADYNEAIHLKPDYANAYYNRGNTYRDLEQYDEALADYNEAIRLNPDHTDAYNNRGATYAALGRYDKALADFNETIRLNPDDADAYYNRGNIYRDLGQYGKALTDFNEAIRLNSEYATAYNNRGAIYAILEQYDKALADYNEAIRLNPDDADAYNNRGATYRDLERYDEALADFNEAIRLNPDDTSAYYNRGATYAALGRYDKALTDFNEAIRLNPDDADAYNNRGNIYRNLEQYDEALTDFNEAINLNPDYAITYYNRGATYRDLGQYDKALTDFNEAIRLTPKYAFAYYGRGLAYAAQDKLDQAIESFETGLQVDQNPNTHQWAEETLIDLKAQQENQ